MPALARLKRAALLRKPPLELLARHYSELMSDISGFVLFDRDQRIRLDIPAPKLKDYKK
jgi:hypothetical protein